MSEEKQKDLSVSALTTPDVTTGNVEDYLVSLEHKYAEVFKDNEDLEKLGKLTVAATEIRHDAERILENSGEQKLVSISGTESMLASDMKVFLYSDSTTFFAPVQQEMRTCYRDLLVFDNQGDITVLFTSALLRSTDPNVLEYGTQSLTLFKDGSIALRQTGEDVMSQEELAQGAYGPFISAVSGENTIQLYGEDDFIDDLVSETPDEISTPERAKKALKTLTSAQAFMLALYEGASPAEEEDN